MGASGHWTAQALSPPELVALGNENPSQKRTPTVRNPGRQASLPNVLIDRVDRRGDNTRQRLVGFDPRLGRVFERENREVSLGKNPDGFHEISLDSAKDVSGGDAPAWEGSLAFGAWGALKPGRPAKGAPAFILKSDYAKSFLAVSAILLP